MRQARGSIPRCPLAFECFDGEKCVTNDPLSNHDDFDPDLSEYPTPGKASDREIDSVRRGLSYTRVAVALASVGLSINHSWPLHGTKQRPRQPHSR